MKTKSSKLFINYKSKNNILFVDRQRESSAYLFSLFASAVNRKYKKKVFLLSDKSENDQIIKSYKNLGLKNFLVGVNKIQYLKNMKMFLSSIFISLFCVLKIRSSGFFWFINNYKVNNILYGDLIYDTYIRFNHKYTNPKLDLKFVKLLIVSTFRTKLILDLITKYKIKIVIVGTEHYSFNSGVALRIAASKRIKNYTARLNINKDFEILEYDSSNILYGYNSLKTKKIQKIFNNFTPSKNEVEKFYINRKKFNSVNFYTKKTFKRANKGSGINFINRILSKKKDNKVILYASHALSDSTHTLGVKFSFQDYYNQFLETLNYVFKNDNKNIWIFRCHPSSNLNGERLKLFDLIKKYKKENIIFCPINVPVKKLYNICDLVVTGRGTIGLEFICEGKQAILSGVPRYAHKNLNLNCCSEIKHYFKLINKLDRLGAVNSNKSYLAKKILYFYESGYFHPLKIENKMLYKDKQLKRLIEILLKKRKRSKDYKIVPKILNNQFQDSTFYSEIERLI